MLLVVSLIFYYSVGIGFAISFGLHAAKDDFPVTQSHLFIALIMWIIFMWPVHLVMMLLRR